MVYQLKGNLGTALDYTRKSLKIFVSIGARIYADIGYWNLREIIEQMKAAGMELSGKDKVEIAELTEAYRKLKGKAVSAASG